MSTILMPTDGEVAELVAGLPPHIREWAPGARSIRNPLPLGQRHDTTPIGLPLWTPEHGARHPLIGGATGSGKSNVYNVLTGGAAACGDVVIWEIEVAKAGQSAAPWLPCIDWLATVAAEAVRMLRCAVRIIEHRSRDLARTAARGGGADKVEPTPDLPYLLIKIDEAAALFGITTGDDELVALAEEATELARRISQTGRSAGVGLSVATQRPTVASLGNDGDFRSQLSPNLCLRMNRRKDVGFVLQGVDLDTVDTTLFNVPGLLYLQDGADTDPLPVRAYALYQPSTVYRLARFLAAGRPALDPAAIAAAGPDYTERNTDPFGDTTPAATARRTTTVPAAKPARRDRAADLDTARALVTDDDNTHNTDVPAVPLANLAAPPADPGDPPTDPAVRDTVAAVIAEAPAEGLSLKDITAAVETIRGTANKGSIHRVIRALGDDGTIRQSGTRGGYRYHPNHPDAPAVDYAA